MDMTGAAVVAVENEPVTFPHAEEERILLRCCSAVSGGGFNSGEFCVDSRWSHCGGDALVKKKPLSGLGAAVWTQTAPRVAGGVCLWTCEGDSVASPAPEK